MKRPSHSLLSFFYVLNFCKIPISITITANMFGVDSLPFAEIWWTLTSGIDKQSPQVSTDGCDKNSRIKEERCQIKIVMLVLIGVVFLVNRFSSNNPPDAQQLCWDMAVAHQWYQKESLRFQRLTATKTVVLKSKAVRVKFGKFQLSGLVFNCGQCQSGCHCWWYFCCCLDPLTVCLPY